MTKFPFLLMIILLPFTQVQGQDMDMGSILNSVADGIKPEAFKGKFSKDLDNWKEASKGIDGLDVSKFKGQMGGLIGGLKGKAFDGVSKGSLLKQLAGINGKSGMTELLSSLVSGLNPEMLTDAFKGKKDMIMGALNKL